MKNDVKELEAAARDATEEFFTQGGQKSKPVEILGQAGVEGYEYKLYHPGNDKSGITIGNGVDFASQTAKSLTKAGVPNYLVEKVQAMGILGLRGDKAKEQLANISPPGLSDFTPGEVATLSNSVTRQGAMQLEKKMGARAWGRLPEGAQIAALSLKHIYGNKFYSHNSYKQLKAGDLEGLKRNMEDYGDNTPGMAKGVNNRHRIMSQYIPTVSDMVVGTMSGFSSDEIQVAQADVMPQWMLDMSQAQASKGFAEQTQEDVNLYQDEQFEGEGGNTSQPADFSQEDIATDPFYRSGR